MVYIKVFFSILVALPILVLGGWLFIKYTGTYTGSSNNRTNSEEQAVNATESQSSRRNY